MKDARETEEVSWRAAEFQRVEKDISWYWILGTVTVILMILALWQKNFFFFIFLALAGPTLLFFGRRHPHVFDFCVSEEGVSVGKKLYRYDEFEGFAVRRREGMADEIVLKRKSTVDPFLKIPVEGDVAERAETLLAKKTKRIQYEPTLLDLILEIMGF